MSRMSDSKYNGTHECQLDSTTSLLSSVRAIKVGTVPKSPIAERIRQLAEDRFEGNLSALARDAKLSRTQVTNTTTRLDRDPGKAELSTLASIAAGARVHLAWLLTGLGPCDINDEGEPFELKNAVMDLCRKSSNPAVRAAADRVAATSFDGAEDWDALKWLKRVEYEVEFQNRDAADPSLAKQRAAQAAKAVKSAEAARRRRPMPGK